MKIIQYCTVLFYSIYLQVEIIEKAEIEEKGDITVEVSKEDQNMHLFMFHMLSIPLD